MHAGQLERWRQARASVPAGQHAAEMRAKVVLGLTLVMMVAELIAGYLTGSMALTADGWHMGSHAAALGIAAFAYSYARRHADNERFSFGTGKVGALAGYSSALLLAVAGLWMAVESVSRLVHPIGVFFDQAIVVACIGLAVNIASAMLLGGGHGHDHSTPAADAATRAAKAHRERHRDHSHAHEHDHDHDDDHSHDDAHADGHDHVAPDHAAHHDHNLRAAYLHVIADALTSVLAIGALVAGKWFGWIWLDPGVAIAASILIGWWAWGLLRSSGRMLLDAEDDQGLEAEIVTRIEADADNRVADLRLWRIGGSDHAVIVSVATHVPRSAEHYKSLLRDLPGLQHVTIEVFACLDEPCVLHSVG